MADVAADEVTNGAEAGEAAPSPAKEKRMPVRRLPKPDQSLVKAQIEKLKDEISQNQQRQDKIREELEKRRSGRTTSTDQQAIKNRLMELRSQFQALLVSNPRSPCQHEPLCGHRCNLRITDPVAASAETFFPDVHARVRTWRCANPSYSKVRYRIRCLEMGRPPLPGAQANHIIPFRPRQANKKQVRSELEAVNNGRDALREQVRLMKGKMEYTSVEKIDEAIARMEGRLQHSSMPLAEEKRVLEGIKKLRASRVRAAQLAPAWQHCWCPPSASCWPVRVRFWRPSTMQQHAAFVRAVMPC